MVSTRQHRSAAAPAARGAEVMPGAAGGRSVQLKQSLRGMAFDAQEQALAPSAAGAAQTTEVAPDAKAAEPAEGATAPDAREAAAPEAPTADGTVPAFTIDPIKAPPESCPVQASDTSKATAPVQRAPGAPAPAAANGDVGGTLAVGTTSMRKKDCPIVDGAYGGIKPDFGLGAITIGAHKPGEAWTADVNLTLETHWGVASSVPNKTALSNPGEVSREESAAAADDLDPSGPSAPAPDGKTARSSYWVPAISTIHELYHTAETERWLENEGRALAQAWFKGRSFLNAAHLENSFVILRDKLDAAWKEYFGVKLGSEAAKPGEQRAYLDGKGAYQNWANALRKRAKNDTT